MAYTRRSTNRRAPARRPASRTARSGYSSRGSRSVRKPARRASGQQVIKLVIETAPANPVSRLGLTPQAPKAPAKAKF